MALALVFAFGFVADVAAFERVREIDKWAKEIDAIVQQLADTYLGDNEFLKRVMESCSFLEDDSDGLEIAERAARELDFAFLSAIQGKDIFKDLAVKEYLKMPSPDLDYKDSKVKMRAKFKNDEMGEDTLWISDDIYVENEADILKDIQWTAAVIPYMSDQLKNHSLIDFVYIGTASGVLRVVPEMELQNTEKDLEFRLQSWYLGKASYQQVIIIMDTSSSMGLYEEEYLVNAKEVAVMLVQSFTSHVDFNIITSSSMIWDIQGQTIEHSTMFLRCLHPPLCEFYSANEQNKNAFIDFIWRIKPRGGTDLHRALAMAFELLGEVKSCKKTIYLITSGQDRDKRVRCSSGTNHFLEENQRRFVPGDVCKYNVETTLLDVSIMQYFVQHQVDINTFITTSQYIFYRRLSRVACQNGGVSLWINQTRGYYAQMKLYSYLMHYSFADSGLLIETSTLTSQSLASQLFFSEAYFIPNSNRTNEFKFGNGKNEKMGGVLGFAINFATLRNLLFGHIWTGAFAFLVRPQDLIVKCYTGLISMTELSQFELSLNLLLNPRGELKEFENIEKVVTSMKSGKVKVMSNPGIPMMSKEGALMIVPASTSVDYYFAPLKSINYTLGYIESEKKVMLTNCTQPETKSRLHTRLDFDPGRMLSAVALLRRAFCDWNSFNLQYNSSEWDNLEDDMNSQASTYQYFPCDGIVTNQAKLEIKATYQLESIWSSLPSLFALLIHINSRFVLTNGGVLRIFPAVVIPKSGLDTITSHGWYREALENEGHVVLTQQKYSGNFLETEESSIFISKTVNFPVNNCNSSYSNSSQCAVFGVFGVTGVLKDTAILFSKALEKYHTDCGLSETSCYIISRNLDVSVELLPIVGNFKKPVNLFERHPSEMALLVKEGIVMNLSLPIMLRKCYKLGDFAHMENPNEEVFFKRDQSNPGSTKMKMKRQYQKPCLKLAYQMVINHSAFINVDFSTTTVKAPCFHSFVYLSPIRSSSHFLMVIRSIQTFAEKCDAPPPLKKPITDIFYFPGGKPRNITKCAPPIYVPIPCLVSAANNSKCSGALFLFAFILRGLLNYVESQDLL